MRHFGTVVTAMVTPFDRSLRVDLGKAKALAQRLLAEGTDSLVVSGTTGESPTLTTEEKIALLTAVKEAAGSATAVIAGTGTNSTASTIALSKAAADAGADALLVVAPYYNKPPQEGLYRHFAAVAEATPLPIIVYNIPGRTAVNITPETLERLAKISTIVGVKESPASFDQVSDVVARTNAGLPSNGSPADLSARSFLVYSGDDSLTLPMISVGAVGVVSVASHIAGPAIKAMVTAALEGRAADAAAIHQRLMPIFKGLFKTTNPILVKAALALAGFEAGGLRLPLVEATAEERTALAAAMAAAGIQIPAKA